MSEEVGLVVAGDGACAYDFGESHPLRPERVLLTYEHLSELGLVDRANVHKLQARVASDAEILAVHDSSFVRCVQRIDEGSILPAAGYEYGLGTPDNPIFENMHAASAGVCGASIVAAEALATQSADHSFNPSGGLHHARRRQASGFCIYNDPAVAIAKILEVQPSWRVLYLDVDVHHGDGVQWIFYDDPRVVTLSLHQTGHTLYPGTGFEHETGAGDALGTSLNVPLPPYTGEEDYLWALTRVVEAAAGAFRPHVLVSQLGADTHHGDPLANLGLTMSAYPRIARLLHQTVHEHCGGRWMATGGGGYQYDSVVPKVWAMDFAEMAGVPEMIPVSWLDDESAVDVSRSSRDSIEDSVDTVLSVCLPRLSSLGRGDVA